MISTKWIPAVLSSLMIASVGFGEGAGAVKRTQTFDNANHSMSGTTTSSWDESRKPGEPMRPPYKRKKRPDKKHSKAEKEKKEESKND